LFSLRAPSSWSSYQAPANATFSTSSRILTHEDGKIVSLDAKSTAEHLSYALSLDQASLSQLQYTSGLTVTNNDPNDARFGRVVLTTQAAPSTPAVLDPVTGDITVPGVPQVPAELLMPDGESQAYSNAWLAPAALIGSRFPILSGIGSTGTVDFADIKSNILADVPAWVALDKIPIAKLDLKPSTWNGISAIGDYTNGVRFPDSAGVNMSGYGSTIVGVNAGRVADVGDPSD